MCSADVHVASAAKDLTLTDLTAGFGVCGPRASAVDAKSGAPRLTSAGLVTVHIGAGLYPITNEEAAIYCGLGRWHAIAWEVPQRAQRMRLLGRP